jgi:hypothetical protein
MAGICIFVLALAVGLETQGETVTVVRAFESGLSGVHARNDAVHLSVGTDPALPDERVLLVDYPVPGSDPAARDVRCEAETSDWSAGRAISFQIKPSHDLRLSVSLVDRNGVAYTTWVDLKENVWQAVRIAFDTMRPNPYFQPPGANLAGPIDVSDVKSVAFAPQDRTSGRLAVSRFVVLK